VTKDRPKNVAASVRARLLKIARENGEDFQLVLIRFALERMLFRLSKSQYAKDFVLKGAILFQIWSGDSHRPTRDVDLLGYGDPSVDRFTSIFQSLAELDVADDGIRFDASSIQVQTIKEEEEYEGIRVKLNAFIESARIPVQVDVGFGDAITPEPSTIEYPAILEFEAPVISVYPRETVVAEKFQAMVMLGISNSRMKDFYDIWKLAKDFEFKGEILSKAIAATFTRRATEVPKSPPLALTSEFLGDSQKATQWKAFCKKTVLDVNEFELPDVIDELNRFLMPVATAIANRTGFNKDWPKGGPWQKGNE
jgi:predicted nucleotidyltransferase component of viral defense system